jgi:hypothetical protein
MQNWIMHGIWGQLSNLYESITHSEYLQYFMSSLLASDVYALKKYCALQQLKY